ncbi:MAG: ATP-binding cassette domain-containing protein [Clostridia bacterium]|nr:ATP-binding cassette domain-containing protein [Clostridia bacterium]
MMKLEFQNISKSYGNTKALQKITAVLEPGIYALLGPNGSGKSTLMNILTDNLKADTGCIIYTDDAGTSENILHMGVRFREKLGFMPQYPGMYPNFTVDRFLWYIAALKDIGIGLRGKEKPRYIAEQIHTVLAEVELDDVSHHRISTLSGGMKQRLALAQAVLGNPEILILDEPTAGLDPKQRISVRNYISRIALNKIVIIATHVVSDVEFIAREAILLKKGVIADMAPPQELIAKMNGKVWEIRCQESEVSKWQQQHPVTKLTKCEHDDGVILRVLADHKPHEKASPLLPSLEDCYLHVFGQQ